MRLVRDANVAFLRERFREMSAHHCYYGMEYSEDHDKIAEWAPLIIDGRDDTQPIAATRVITGTDVDWMQAAGLIGYRRGKIEIVDRPGLEKAACECYAMVQERFNAFLTPPPSAVRGNTKGRMKPR